MPTCRPESYAKFVEAWTPLFEKHDVNLIPVWDIDGKRDPDLPWFIPTGTDMIRSWGFYKAWKSGSEYTLSLDDDVLPQAIYEDGLPDIFEEYEREFRFGSVCSPYLSVGAFTNRPYQMRGFPYSDRKFAQVAIQYGGWDGVLDYDAATQLACSPRDHARFRQVVVPVPRGVPVTTCIMNCAFRTEYAPIMWQLPMLDGKYNRFGDIWSGCLQKLALDVVNEVMLINGNASVRHERASDPVTNLQRESLGIKVNESLWYWLTSCHYTSESLTNMYRSVLNRFSSHPDLDQAYADHLQKTSIEWLNLFGALA